MRHGSSLTKKANSKSSALDMFWSAPARHYACICIGGSPIGDFNSGARAVRANVLTDVSTKNPTDPWTERMTLARGGPMAGPGYRPGVTATTPGYLTGPSNSPR